MWILYGFMGTNLPLHQNLFRLQLYDEYELKDQTRHFKEVVERIKHAFHLLPVNKQEL